MARMDKARAALGSIVRRLPAADLKAGESPEEEAAAKVAPMIPRRAWVAIGVIAVTVAAVVIGAQVQRQREHDRRVDTYYCTRSDVGLLDRGPNTGKRCIDLLEDWP